MNNKALDREREESIIRFFGSSETRTADSMEFLHEFGSASQLLLYSIVFCPPVTELNGSIVLTESVRTSDDKNRFLAMCLQEGVGRAEESFNLFEIGYLFSPDGRDSNDQQDEIIARYMKMTWKGMLSERYPNRKFIVRICSASETGSTVAVTFSEESP